MCQVFLKDSYCNQQRNSAAMDDSYLGMLWDILEYLMSLDSLLSFTQLYYTSTGPDCAAVHPGRLSTSQSPFLGELTTGANGELKTRTRSKLFGFFCLSWSTGSKVTTLLQGPRRDAPGCGEERNRWVGGICHCLIHMRPLF